MLINQALPEDLRRDEGFRFDKQGMHSLLQQLAEKHPDQYKETLQKLNDIGRSTAYSSGSSVSLSALAKSPAKEQVIGEARKRVQQIIEDDKIPQDQKDQQIIDTLLPLGPKLQDAMYEEAKKENNPYYLQLISGSRGKKSDYNSLRGADLLTADHTGKVLPVPLFHSYAEGMDPVEYWAGLYGQRKGDINTKLSTGEAGFMGKKLANATHRIVVTKDTPDPTRLPVGLPVDPKDQDNVGAVLAADAGPFKAGQTITPDMLRQIREKGTDEIVIHSPLTEPTPDGGISRLAAGRRDRFDLSRIGDNIGIPAAQALSEKLSQGSLSSKHNSLMAKAKGPDRSGFDYINRLIEAPESFPEAGPLADEQGVVKSVERAPQGGHHITIGSKKHYVHAGLDPIVKPGDQVDQGDDLTNGIPHPSDLVQHRGIGEARRVYLGLLGEALNNSGIAHHRRNLEAVVAGLLNWTQVKDPNGIGEHVPDDIVGYGQLTHGYKPREDATLQPVRHSIGRYMEEPGLHYGVGTKITKKVAKHLDKHGIADVYSHAEPPGFEPVHQRGLLATHQDPDWQVPLAGFYSSSAFQHSLSRGATSDPNSTSFVPALARGKGFGKGLGTTGTYGSQDPD
jgi:DNA-directed RNA polymerase subunit beta'